MANLCLNEELSHIYFEFISQVYNVTLKLVVGYTAFWMQSLELTLESGHSIYSTPLKAYQWTLVKTY
jgi:hypothetical protein